MEVNSSELFKLTAKDSESADYMELRVGTLKKPEGLGGGGACMPLIPAHGRQRQTDLCQPGQQELV